MSISNTTEVAFKPAPPPPAVTPINPRPPRAGIPTIIAEVWDARELVVQFILRDITVRYTQAVMGFAWAMLMPLLIVGAGLVFRIALSTMSGGHVDSASVGSLALKALPWAFFSAAISQATQSIIASANLIGKVYFPRESLPLASVAAQGVDLVVGGLAVGVILPFLGVHLSFALLWVPVLLLLLVMFTVGCSLILSCANLFYRDVKYIVQVVLNFGVFATPVFFEPQMLGPVYGPLLLRLPLSPYIQGIDIAVTHGHNLLQTLQVETLKGPVTIWAPWMLLYATILAVGLLAIGLRVFRNGAGRFAEMA